MFQKRRRQLSDKLQLLEAELTTGRLRREMGQSAKGIRYQPGVPAAERQGMIMLELTRRRYHKRNKRKSHQECHRRETQTPC